MAEIFISYKRGHPASERLLTAMRVPLEAAGHQPLVDVEIRAGEEWSVQLSRWMSRCAAAIVLVSAEARASTSCQHEWSALRVRHDADDLRIVPVFVDGSREHLGVLDGLQAIDGTQDEAVVVAAAVAGLAALPPPATTVEGWASYREQLARSVRRLTIVGLAGATVTPAEALPLRVRAGDDESPFDGRFLHLRGPRRILVTGDSGAGKSGLTRLIAAEALGRGLRVVRGRLKVAAARIVAGDGVVVALGAAMMDGHAAPADLAAILATADLILLDGLDEAEAAGRILVDYLRDWTHPGIVIVTSRDAANARDLAAFHHAVILPIKPREAGTFARRLGGERAIDEAVLGPVVDLFDEHPAFATPLLIGFVLGVAFAAGAGQVPTGAAQLYERVVVQLARSPRPDRVLETKLDSEHALQGLAEVAWHVWQTPDLDVEALRGVGSTAALHTLPFWEERGLLEVRRGPRRDTIDFVHQSVAEYGAARYLSRLRADQRGAIANERADDPRWTQVLSLAAGLNDAEPLIRGALSAGGQHRALVAGELAASSPRPCAVAELVDRLVGCIDPEATPIVARDAAALLARLIEARQVDGAYAAELIGDHADRSTVWDRLGALRVRIAAVAAGASTGDVAAWMLSEADRKVAEEARAGENQLVRSLEGWGSSARGWWGMYQHLVRLAIQAISAATGDDAAVELLNELEARELISLATRDDVQTWARRTQHPIVESAGRDLRENAARRFVESSGSRDYFAREQERRRAIYLAFADACPESAADGDAGVSFAIVLHSCGCMESATVDAVIFEHPHARARLAPVLRAWVLALRLEPALVGDHARRVVAQFDAKTLTFDFLPDVPRRERDWSVVHGAGLVDARTVVRLLNDGSNVGLVGLLVAPIVVAWRPWSEMVDAFEDELPRIRPHTWRILAHLAPNLWGDEASSRALALIDRSERPEALEMLRAVSPAAFAEPAVRARIRAALSSTDEEAGRPARVGPARAAAALLERLPLSEALAEAWLALEDWTARPVTGDTRSIPDSPRDLLAALIVRFEPDRDKLRRLATHYDRDVRRAALEWMRGSFVPAEWDELGSTVAGLEAIDLLAGANTTAEQRRWLLARGWSPDPGVRASVARSLGASAREPAVHEALHRLASDADPEVRDEATKALRGRGD